MDLDVHSKQWNTHKHTRDCCDRKHNLDTQPQQGATNLQFISYNCSISSSQIQVIPNYNGSNCDTINSQTINQPNSLAVSLTSTIGNKCNGGNNLGVIIGLSVGIKVNIYFTYLVLERTKENFRIELKVI